MRKHTFLRKQVLFERCFVFHALIGTRPGPPEAHLAYRSPETRKRLSPVHQVTPYVCTNMDMISQNDNRLLLVLSRVQNSSQ